MKKLLAVTSGLLAMGSTFVGAEAPAFKVDASLEFDSAHVSEGRRTMDQNFAPNVEIGLPLFGAGELYVGLDAYLKANNKETGRNEVAPYVGFSYNITDIFTIDFGYAYRRFGNLKFNQFTTDRMLAEILGEDSFKSVKKALNEAAKDEKEALIEVTEGLKEYIEYELSDRSKQKYAHETYIGLLCETFLTPALYFTYDFTQRKANIEGSVNYIWDLSSFGANGFSIDLGAKVGYSRMKRPYGIKFDQENLDRINKKGIGGNEGALAHITGDEPADDWKSKIDDVFGKQSYGYISGNSDLVYSLHEHVKARAGLNASFNSAGKNSLINSINNKKHNVWFSTAIEFVF